MTTGSDRNVVRFPFPDLPETTLPQPSSRTPRSDQSQVRDRDREGRTRRHLFNDWSHSEFRVEYPTLLLSHFIKYLFYEQCQDRVTFQSHL